MKKLSLIVGLLAANCMYSQTDLEDRDDSFIIENNKNLLKIDIKDPFLQIAAKDCGNFKAAAYDGGTAAYREVLRRYMYMYLNSDFYTLTGEFTFTLTIDAAGKVTDVTGSPKVLNSEVFFDDMKYIVRRINKSWSPATCNGQPIKSEMKLKMNFASMSADM